MQIDDNLIYDIIESANASKTEKLYFLIGKVSKLYKYYSKENQEEKLLGGIYECSYNAKL